MPSRFSRTTRALTHDTSRYALVTWGVAGLLLGAWLLWFFFGRVTVYEISGRARLEVQQAAHPVAAARSGRILSTALVLGREVAAGEVLVELDASEQVLRLHEEEARLAAIPPRIDSVEREIALREQAATEDRRTADATTQTARHRVTEANTAVEFARDNARRLREESSIGSVPQMDAARASAEAQKLGASRDALSSDIRRLESDARTRARQNEAQVEALRRSVVSMKGDMDTIRSTIERLKLDIERLRIRAPVAGRLGDVVPMQPGTVVAEGQKLATVIPRGGLVIMADYDPAAALGRIRPGARARLRLDGFPWAQYGSVDAVVSRVGTEVRDNAVRIELTPDPSSPTSVPLQHGLPGSVEIRIEDTSPALLVLRAAGQIVSRTTPPAPEAVRGTRP